MEQWEKPACGSVRIKNPRTLKRWITNGEYQSTIDEGYIFNVGCGRFRFEKCTCHQCRNYKRANLQKIIDDYEKKNSN